MTQPRPMTAADAPGVLDLMACAFGDLLRRFHRPVPPRPPDPQPGLLRIRHLLSTDPGGAWITEVEGRPAGAALALVRDALWGLSLLVVDPREQSAGIGRALLARALAHGADTCSGGIIGASEDARALRAYARAGFDLHPAMDARGPVRVRPSDEPAVRAGAWPGDRDLIDRVGRTVRGAGHGVDVPVWLGTGGTLLVHEGGGFAVVNGAELKVLAAEDPAVAQALLRAVLLTVPEGEVFELDFLTAGQDWAVGVLLDAGVDLSPGGAVMTRGTTGTMRPYIPSGAYL